MIYRPKMEFHCDRTPPGFDLYRSLELIVLQPPSYLEISGVVRIFVESGDGLAWKERISSRQFE